MIIPDDLYRHTLTQPLKTGSGSVIGTVQHTYDVRQVVDVRNLTSVRSYRVTCTQRIVIPNKNGFDPTPTPVKQYQGYPAMITTSATLNATGNKHLWVLSYSPRTLNTAVSTSRSGNDATNSSVSRQHTSGSSTSETNTFGANASFGFFGGDLTGSLGMDYSHSETDEHSRSISRGSDHGTSHETGGSESMSIKDWASYAFLAGVNNTVPNWVWAQEYPWDIIQYRDALADTGVQLPEFVLERLFDSTKAPTQVFPPSQLSLFGVDFTMKAAWLLDLPPAVEDQTITLTHNFNYATATHGINSGGTPPTKASFDPAPGHVAAITSDPLDLTVLGLDPVHGPGGASGAVIGFIPGKFLVPPAVGSTFKILSEENTLQVTGTGFDAGMVGTMATPNAAVPTLWVMFKVLDTDFDYTLYLKGWMTQNVSWAMVLEFNDDPSSTVLRHVDSLEGEGGDDNLTVINLRNKDYTSVDYHDYLVLGLNKVKITLTPNATPAGYQLRALAIGGS